MIPDDVWDIPVLLVWICLGLTSISMCLGIMSRNLKTYTMSDKTAIVNINDNTETPYTWSVRDYMLMLLVADEFQPEPAAVDIQFGGANVDSTIYINQDYLKNKAGRIQRYYINFLSNHVNDTISGMEYVYDNPDGGGGRWRFNAN